MGCFSRRLMSAASDQKLFCKLCSPFCCSFNEFVEEKVISPSYSSAILTPPIPHQCSCLENPHGQRCLAGYSLWGHKESDMTEQLNTVKQHRREKGEESLFKERIAENFTDLGKETTVQVHES